MTAEINPGYLHAIPQPAHSPNPNANQGVSRRVDLVRAENCPSRPATSA